MGYTMDEKRTAEELKQVMLEECRGDLTKAFDELCRRYIRLIVYGEREAGPKKAPLKMPLTRQDP